MSTKLATKEDKDALSDTLAKLSDFLDKSNIDLCVGVLALQILVINACMSQGVNKPQFLGMISSNWELVENLEFE